MTEKREIFNELPFVGNFGKDKTDFLFRIGELVETPERYVLAKQFEPAHFFYFLIEGSVDFSISTEGGTGEFPVGGSGGKFTPVGWSGFRSPQRYHTTTTCEEPCALLRWNHRNLEKFFDQEPLLGREFLLFVLERSADILNGVRESLAQYRSVGWDAEAGRPGAFSREGISVSVPGPTALLRKSSFFEVFPENILRRLAKAVRKKYCLANEPIFRQGEASEGIDMLAYGKAVLRFSPGGAEGEAGESAALHRINVPGSVVGWAGAAAPAPNSVTAVAERNSVVYHISARSLRRIMNRDPGLSLAFARRLLWLSSVRLRSARTGLVSQRSQRETLAVSNLLDQNSVQLSVNSPIHKLPHLLGSPLTLGDAFRLLSGLEKKGGNLERELSRTILDILAGTYREHNFFEGLRNVYESVAAAPASLCAGEIRTMAAKQFAGVFRSVPHVIEGWENLPEKPGHVFIYNHLLNHPCNTLPNHFQITLDSHFISSMILYPKYGEPGIRVVRVPRAEEYGHAGYYERLGHINVYTGESGPSAQTAERKKEQRRKFYETAGKRLAEGFNIAISPEGTSTTTEQSPGPFRLGAFLLAASVDPEPLIVPVAVANFDKRTDRNVFCAVIRKPFRISDRVPDPAGNRAGIAEFAARYEKEYRGYVEEAAELAVRAESAKTGLSTFGQAERELSAIDPNLFEKDVKALERRRVGKLGGVTAFYGSSSFRLWSGLARDFAGHNVVNLGFGGARIAYCLHYLERLVKPNDLGSLVFYAGDNDIGDGCLPRQVLNSFVDFYHRFREFFPRTKITFVSIKPSPARAPFLERIRTANGLVRQFLSKEPDAFYLNVHDRMLDGNGEIRKELFTSDGLHMSRKGYLLWKKLFLESGEEIFGGPGNEGSQEDALSPAETERPAPASAGRGEGRRVTSPPAPSPRRE